MPGKTGITNLSLEKLVGDGGLVGWLVVAVLGCEKFLLTKLWGGGEFALKSLLGIKFLE